MLVLTRKSNESLKIGEGVTVTVIEVKGSQVRLGIDAPSGVRIYRTELYERVRTENVKASGQSRADFEAIRRRIR